MVIRDEHHVPRLAASLRRCLGSLEQPRTIAAARYTILRPITVVHHLAHDQTLVRVRQRRLQRIAQVRDQPLHARRAQVHHDHLRPLELRRQLRHQLAPLPPRLRRQRERRHHRDLRRRMLDPPGRDPRWRRRPRRILDERHRIAKRREQLLDRRRVGLLRRRRVDLRDHRRHRCIQMHLTPHHRRVRDLDLQPHLRERKPTRAFVGRRLRPSRHRGGRHRRCHEPHSRRHPKLLRCLLRRHAHPPIVAGIVSPPASSVPHGPNDRPQPGFGEYPNSIPLRVDRGSTLILAGQDDQPSHVPAMTATASPAGRQLRGNGGTPRCGHSR